MTRLLLGSTGFVGTTLLSQTDFDEYRHSTDIDLIDGHSYDLAICATAPAKKWYANMHPDEDRGVIDGIIEHLKAIKAKEFILISTVDVFKSPVGVDENTGIDMKALQPYGLNRRRLELFVQQHFENSLIVRLPGLVGHGLKKNIIFDFKHKNEVEKIESDNVFQFYPMKDLWHDIQIAREHGLKCIHMTAAPISVKEVAQKAFGMDFDNHLGKPLVSYDFMTVHAALWDQAHSDYQYSKEKSLEAIVEYAQED